MKRCNLKTFCKKVANNNKSFFFLKPHSGTYTVHSLSFCVRTPLIPLDETIDIHIKCRNPETLVNGISKHNLHNLLNLTTKESFLSFNKTFYIQVDGITLGFCHFWCLESVF